ncbi:MAG: MarR family transcriptional regulator [Gemmobacter sp.]|uniref:MarR family winged helix-turn-helix transcriptional regulator n=1 Tax=Gemmobacter sp. TaxID=1898957 RepID=UPI001A4F263D|nr:MarR family transcriptional regulator [Gemmobacter sp.]MBL8561985.1 MarR family transcriptional regulator [Gemmobacter sp.]
MVSGLTDHLGFWLRQVSNQVSGRFARALEAEGVSVVEWVLLRDIYDAGLPVPQVRLAERMGLTRGAITKLADRLVARGLILRQGDALDGRVQGVALTRAGEALVPALAALADTNDAACFAALTAEEQASLRALLQKLAEAQGLTRLPVG